MPRLSSSSALPLVAMTSALLLAGCYQSYASGGDGGRGLDASAADGGAPLPDGGSPPPSLCGDGSNCGPGNQCCPGCDGDFICWPDDVMCAPPPCPPPRSCDSDGTCEDDEFCDFGLSTTPCGILGGSPGVCTPRPVGCPDIYDLVCGCDLMEYGNACEANALGLSVAYDGPCYFVPIP